MNKKDLKQNLTAKFNFSAWKDVLDEIFSASSIEYFSHEVSIDAKLIKSGGQIGTILLNDGRSLAIFKFEVADNINISRNRKGLRDIAARYVDQSLIHGALVFFYSEEQIDYRLTFIAKQTSFNDEGQLVKTETAPKRYTFLLGENEPCTTATNRLYELYERSRKNGSVYLADVTEAFSVERLNKDFFDGYKKQYKKFLDTLSDTKQHRDYVKKLLGRIVFLHFLQKKGWMGVPATSDNWIGGDKNYLANLVDKYNGNSRLLSDVLEPLFFNTLNKSRTGDLVDPILGDNIKIPYLNGGLFDKDDLDKLDIDYPYDYFKDLMDFFSQYNFTIDENDPDDSEVGIDPEMLGHIFENLLEDNKDKGAFYTPKEIVQYMSRESVIQYLTTHINDDLFLGNSTEQIRDLINRHRVSEELQELSNAERLYKLLSNVKVCDPAIGSGAFPMGVLNVLYHTRHLLHAFAYPKKDFVSVDVKRDIIQNNIYGVDIEQGAVDIARLRFWLSLVVDAETPQPLPNLDYKIVCGNSLLNRHAIDVPIDDVFAYYNRKNKTDFTLSDYQQLVAEYTNTSDHTLKDKFREKIADIKQAFQTSLTRRMIEKRNKIQGQILNLESDTLFGPPTKECLKQAKELRKKYAKLLDFNNNAEIDKLYDNAFEWRFEFPSMLNECGEFIGFDIVIGNPPYQRIQGIRAVNPIFADELSDKYKSATGSFDLYALFTERGLQLINQQGVLNFIMPVKWTNAAFGKGLRGIISESCAAYKIVNFGAYQVFNASTYTGLQWFRKESDKLTYFELNRDLNTNQELGDYLSSLKDNDATFINASALKEIPWVLTFGKNTEVLDMIKQHTRTIGDVFDKIFQGLATSKDDVYFIYECIDDGEKITGFSKQLGRTVTIERGLVKPLLKGEDVHRYDNIFTDRYVIFPYKIESGKAILYAENELSKLYPKGYIYLKECEDVLRSREKGRFNIDGSWYQYGRKQGIISAEKVKLVAPDISMGGNFAFDEDGTFYQTTTVYGYLKKNEIKESYKFWMALLNSRLCWWYLINTGTTLANGFFRFKPDYIKPFPIPDTIIESMADAIVRVTDYILMLKSLSPNTIINEFVDNDVIVRQFEMVIDALIYEMYFPTQFKKADISFVKDVLINFSPINDCEVQNSIYLIGKAFNHLCNINSEIRNNLKYMAVALPSLSPIFNV